VDGLVDIRYEAESSENAGGAGRQSASVDGGPRSSRSSSHLLAVIEYHVTVTRRRRLIDAAFFWAVASATILNAFRLTNLRADFQCVLPGSWMTPCLHDGRK